jgi:aldose 1-epimerase
MYFIYFLLSSCFHAHKNLMNLSSSMKIPLGEELDGKQVILYTLKNNNGLAVQITNFGGRVVSLWVPDKDGNFDDIVTGYKTLDGYLNSKEIYFGALIGRYGNRIANGRFTLNDSIYTLVQNNGENHLHGGTKGFQQCGVGWESA